MNTNKIVFDYRKAFFAPAIATKDEVAVEAKYVAALNQNFNNIGFTLSAAFLEHLKQCTKEAVSNFYKETYRIVLDATGNHKAKPIWKNFPEDVKEADKLELYLVNIIFYLTGGTWAPEYDPSKELPKLIDFSKLSVIDMAKEDEFEDILKNMLLQNMPLSQDDRVILLDALKEEKYRKAMEEKLGNEKIPQKETLAMVAAAYIKEGEMPIYIKKQFVNAKDVLRVMAVMSGSDASLASRFKINSFKRKERRILMELLARQNSLAEDMVSEREIWKRVGERLHPGEFAQQYPEVVKVFASIRSNEHIETYMGKLEEYFRKGEYVKAAEHLTARPGLFARNLDMLLRKAEAFDKLGMSCVAILGQFATVAKDVDMRVLLSLRNHFANRDNTLMLSTGRKSGASSRTESRVLEPLSKETRELADKIISTAFVQYYSLKEKLGKVYVSPSLENIKMPTTLRNTKRALFTATSGSCFPVEEDTEVIRGFCYWLKEDEDEDVDIDLSVTFMDEKFQSIESVGYYNPSDKKMGAVHSGDVRHSGPDGGCEYLDFNIAKARKAKARYAAYTINSFSNQKFTELDSCFMGFMCRDDKTGEIFEPKTVKNRFDLSGDAQQCLMFIVDIKENKVYIADLAIGSEKYSSAYGQRDTISMFTQVVIEDKSLSVMQLLQSAAEAEFIEFCENPEEADILITDEDVKTKEDAKKVHPYDITSIVNLLV